ncbi:MAG TPA: hypothetical protein PLU72_04970 [Candidatus Ozemobacteraceae bacterium]|nr:hypothetical protein [Candidatus Ozemobacteraceae bacterium]
MCLLLMLAGGSVVACELPAEPTAAVIPAKDDMGELGISIVNKGDGTNYFLVPANQEIKMYIVWDPYDHNGSKAQKKYDYVWKPDYGNIGFENRVPATDGHGFFPLSAMAKFFTVQGNRKDVSEAFGRATGETAPENTFLPDNGLKPSELLIQGFVKGDNDATVSIEGHQASAYPHVSNLCDPTGNDLNVSEGETDSVLPNNWDIFSPKTFTPPIYSKNGKNYRKTATFKQGSSGLFIGDLNIGMTTLKNEDYKAYIVEGGPNVWLGDEALPVLPDGAKEGGVGNSTGEITVKFPTPTLGSSGPIKVKVICPPAGFEITNLFWAWEEDLWVEVASDTNGDDVFDSFYIDSDDPESGVRTLKCSVGLKLVVNKVSNAAGYSAFHVYNTQPPITSKLAVTANTPYNTGDSSVSVPFSLSVYGSDPFANLPVPDGLHGKRGDSGITIKHDSVGMKNSIKLFMSYPVYSFKPSGILGVNDLDQPSKMNLGLIGFDSSSTPTDPKWKGMYYEQKWVWLPGTVSADAPTFVTLNADGQSTLGGGVWTITGSAQFNVPVPQHFANDGSGKSSAYSAHEWDYPAPDSPDVTKLWKVFAVAEDASGFKSVSYDDVVGAIDPATVKASAGKVWDNGVVLPDEPSTVLKTEYDNSPPLENSIPSDIAVDSEGYTWQSYAYLKCADNTPPEIQLIVFDTRNNLYHIFGTNAGGDGKIADSNPSFSAYQTANPYGTADNTEITNGLKFEAFDSSLYNRFIDKEKKGGASALNPGDGIAGKGFVCQANTRLVFYIRAWDNINTFSEADRFGVDKISYTVRDDNKASADTPPNESNVTYDPQGLMQNPPFWQFRAPNVSGGTPDGKEYSITVKAKDFAGKERELVLKIYAVGSDLNIRSLEEKRQRN